MAELIVVGFDGTHRAAEPGDSAVFVLARASDPAAVIEQFRGYGGKILRSTLPREAAQKFQQLMAPAR
jgi:uncharacterized membrane protein